MRRPIDNGSSLLSGREDHRAAGGLVLWAPVPGYKGFLHMAQAQQEGDLFNV